MNCIYTYIYTHTTRRNIRDSPSRPVFFPHKAVGGAGFPSARRRRPEEGVAASEVTHDDRWLVNQGANRIPEALSEARTSKLQSVFLVNQLFQQQYITHYNYINNL